MKRYEKIKGEITEIIKKFGPDEVAYFLQDIRENKDYFSEEMLKIANREGDKICENSPQKALCDAESRFEYDGEVDCIICERAWLDQEVIT